MRNHPFTAVLERYGVDLMETPEEPEIVLRRNGILVEQFTRDHRSQLVIDETGDKLETDFKFFPNP